MKNLSNVTCITTVYKTPDLMKTAYESLRIFYPTIEFLVVDNSEGDECTKYLDSLMKKDCNLNVIKPKVNIGHGDGMHLGLENIKTKFAFIFDSDVIFRNGEFIERMLYLMEENTYGVGWLIELDQIGRDVDITYKGDTVTYLYPAFCLINKNQYFSFHKFTKYGLPPLEAMKELKAQRLDKKMLKSFPIREYLKHLSGATRGRYGSCEMIVK